MRKLTLILSLILVVGSYAIGQSIFSNPITATNPSSSNPYTTGQTFDPNITVSGIGRGSGLIANNALNRYNARDWSTGGIDLTEYFYFTLTPNTDATINFSSFDYTAQASNNGPSVQVFRSSVDGYASDIASFSLPTDGNPYSGSIDLSAAAFQNITTAITFRVYGWSAIDVNGTFSINDFTFNAAVSLPIELTAFNARAINEQSALNWSTASERDNDYFAIERGDNVTRFEEIGQVKGAGDSNEPQHYSFTDKAPLPGKNYYRLRQVDFDGSASYSPVVSVNFGDEGGITLSPVPIRDQLRVQLEKANQEDGVWQIIDMNGRILRSGVFPAETTEYQINASDLPEGSYVFRLVAGREVWVKRF